MDRWTVETTASDDGTLWRAEQTRDGVLVDATRWTAHPVQAIRDLRELEAGTYWVSDNRRPYAPAA